MFGNKEKRYTEVWLGTRQTKTWVKEANAYTKRASITKGELVRIAIDFLRENIPPEELRKTLKEVNYKHYEN